MTSVTLRMPEDLVDGLRQLAPVLGFTGYQPLIRAHVGQGMRHDTKRLEKDRVCALVESLRRHGVSDDVISAALEDVGGTAEQPLADRTLRALELRCALLRSVR